MIYPLRIFFYLLISSFWFCSSSVVAQKADIKSKEELELKPEFRPIIRVGFDPTRFALAFLQKADRGGVEFSLDSEIFPKFYPAVEMGYSFADLSETAFNLHIDGLYGRIGFDYNMVTPANESDHDAFFLGLRIASSHFSQKMDGISLSNRFGSRNFDLANEQLTAYWSEITVGVKVEAFKNFYVGWTGRGKIKFSLSESELAPYIIPGYGRIPKDSNFTADMNIYLLYAFSLK